MSTTSTPTVSAIITPTKDEYDSHVNHEHTNHEHVARERERERERQAVGESEVTADRNLGRENLRE